MARNPLIIAAALCLSACGGSSGTDAYQAAIDRAAAKEAEAVSLGATSPCSQALQCATLAFQHTTGHCSSMSYTPYSLLSPTAAAASAAAADEVVAANQALAAAPPPATACTAAIVAAPALVCMANTCQAAAVQ